MGRYGSVTISGLSSRLMETGPRDGRSSAFTMITTSIRAHDQRFGLCSAIRRTRHFDRKAHRAEARASTKSCKVRGSYCLARHSLNVLPCNELCCRAILFIKPGGRRMDVRHCLGDTTVFPKSYFGSVTLNSIAASCSGALPSWRTNGKLCCRPSRGRHFNFR